MPKSARASGGAVAICASTRSAMVIGSAFGAVTVRAATAANTANWRGVRARNARRACTLSSLGQATSPIESISSWDNPTRSRFNSTSRGQWVDGNYGLYPDRENFDARKFR